MADTPSVDAKHRELHRSYLDWYFPSQVIFDKAQTFCGVGVTADFAKHRGMRRTQCIALVAVAFLISQLVGLRVQVIEQLQYAVMLVGISFGGVFGLLPTIVIEWFGMGLSSPPFLLKLRELTSPL